MPAEAFIRESARGADLQPAVLAASFAEQDDLVFLDTSLRSGSGDESIIACRPVKILQGRLPADQDVLRGELKRGLQQGAGESHGGLFGQVGFDGRFIFGVFPESHVFRGSSHSWSTPPELRPIARARGIEESSPHAPLNFEPLMTRAAFVERVLRSQEYIAAGDIYQVNLSYPWQAAWPSGLRPWSFYEALRKVSPSPFGAFLRMAGETTFSASPECFLKMKDRHIHTRPIKGTRPRGEDAESDRALAEELSLSAKERSELVMITDLERNDLGRVCEYGSVSVTDLLKLERFAQVQHLVSTVKGVLRQGTDHLDAFLACFPGGSISGAPKKRALEIIAELEPFDREFYTGAIGYFGFNGESQFSVAIRTAWLAGGTVQFHTGAGIVADSDPDAEYDETLHKAAGLLAAASCC